MTKYLGTIIAWIIIAGVALYVVRHFAELAGVVPVVRGLFE